MDRNQQIRHEVLLQLYAAGLGMAVSPLHMSKVAGRAGDDFTVNEMRQACLFQVGQGFAEKITDAGSGQEKFTITSKGVIQWENVESK